MEDLAKKCHLKVVLVDFDGTVVDTMELLSEKASEIISRSLKIPRAEARRKYLSLVGRPFREQLKILGVNGEEIIEKLAEEFENFKRGLLMRIELHERVKERISLLKEAGLKVVLSTNSECNVVKSNRALLESFDLILCHDPLTGIKKGRDHLEKVKATYGVRECEVIFIGDSDYDIELYRSLGVRTCKTKGLWSPSDKCVEEVLKEVLRGERRDQGSSAHR